MGKKAILLGASGLIGSNLLSLLLQSDDYKEISIFVREKLPIIDDKLTQVITDFEDLEVLKKDINTDVVFCCLGSTKKKTPDLKKYKRIDHDIPVFFAKEALGNGAKQYHIITALGANANSSSFYSKIKGEVENDLKSLSYAGLFIYQPSFLEGDRDENRPLENLMSPVMSILNVILRGPLKKYQSIEAKDVAKAMLNESIKNKNGIFVHESDKIKELA